VKYLAIHNTVAETNPRQKLTTFDLSSKHLHRRMHVHEKKAYCDTLSQDNIL
jgi:hypothetical protein